MNGKRLNADEILQLYHNRAVTSEVKALMLDQLVAFCFRNSDVREDHEIALNDDMIRTLLEDEFERIMENIASNFPDKEECVDGATRAISAAGLAITSVFMHGLVRMGWYEDIRNALGNPEDLKGKLHLMTNSLDAIINDMGGIKGGGTTE